MWTHSQRDIYLRKWEPLNLSHHFAKFDAYMSCEKGDVTFLFCRVTSSDHEIKETCELVSGKPSI